MTQATISENLFEQLCTARNVPCKRIPRAFGKTPDYEVVLGAQHVAVEVKQLDPNPADHRVNRALDETSDTDGVIAPAHRLRNQIAIGYRQLKAAARAGQPCLLVVYNNAGFLNFIDSFSVTTAMFGTYGIHLGLTQAGEVCETGRGFMGRRRLTRDERKLLSAIGVLVDTQNRGLCLEAYHNPFALDPIEPRVMALLATAQFRHPNPHDGLAVPREPTPIGT